MKQYRPNVELQRRRYSSMISQRVLRRHQGKPPERTAGRNSTPDSSEPWLPGGVRSMADAMWISDQIKDSMERWHIKPPRD
ncbi:MAG: hypothetical protein PHC88_14995 [Terrimicrobiaceae bacterium]|nr:hypothetical protein [Terrimicrobiaceae bacterium]